MAISTYSVLNWIGSPPTPITLAEMPGSSGGGSGNPQSIFVVASNSVPLPPGSAMWMTLLGQNASGVDNNGFISVTAYLFADDPQGKSWNGGMILTDGVGDNPASIFDVEFTAVIGAPVGTTVDIVAQVGYSDASLTLDSPPTGPPDGIFPPTNLTATLAADHVALAWVDNSDNELGFDLEWSTVPAASWAKFATVPAGVTTYRDYAIESGEAYSYRVYAFKADKRSIDSNIATTDVPLVLEPDSGSAGGGTAFTITGNFTDTITTTVTFGGVEATDLVVITTAITGQTPAHEAGVVDVVVSRATDVTLPDAFEFTTGERSPHLEVSAPQTIAPPLPSTVAIAATVVDDPHGLFDEATYAWTIISGPAAGVAGLLLGSPNAATTSVTATVYEAGVYTIEVIATGADVAGTPFTLQNFAQITLSTRAAPRVTAETIRTTYPDRVVADPAVEDDGWGGPLTYQWTQVGGPGAATILSPQMRATEILLPNLQGTYAFQLTASNGALSGSGIVRVVQDAEVQPAAAHPGTTLTITIGGVSY